MQIQILSLESIRLDGDTQSRDGVKQDIVNEYADDMREGAVFPPVVVYNDGKALWLSEGFHRIYAARQAGIVKVETEVREGSRRDAQLNSMRSNATHGARRTNADKRRAVEMAFRWLVEEGRSVESITNVKVAEMAAVSEFQVRQLRDGIVEIIGATSIKTKAQEITNPTPPDLTVTQKLKEEKERLQKDLDKALEMATAAEAKAAELHKAREEAERLKAQVCEMKTHLSSAMEEIDQLKLQTEPQVVEVEKIVEKQVPVEDPATAFRLKKAEGQRDKYEMELKKIQQEGRDWRRLEEKKSKLENEITKLTMRATEKRTEMTLMTAIENVEHSRYISDRIHDMCQRGEMTMEQLDEAERVMNAMVAAGKNCLAVIQGERAGLMKAKGGLRVVE